MSHVPWEVGNCPFLDFRSLVWPPTSASDGFKKSCDFVIYPLFFFFIVRVGEAPFPALCILGGNRTLNHFR